MKLKTSKELEEKAKEIRREIIKMLSASGSGHPGGSLSATDIMVALFYHEMNYNPTEPLWPDRDRFVLSKGHCCPALYAILADLGYFPKEKLKTLRKLGSPLQGHPSYTHLNAVESSTGPLGQGLSVGNGIALAGKLDKKDFHVYVMLGDGEMQEGNVWEAMMTSSHYKIDNLTAIVDYNNLQIDGKVSEVKGVMPLKDKFKSFGWEVFEVNGHKMKDILKVLEKARKKKGKPSVVIAKTVKGKGVSFMENVVDFHGVTPNEEETKKALKELE
ncbi:MAG: transketolase [Candidatus Diapherotrites archaeon]